MFKWLNERIYQEAVDETIESVKESLTVEMARDILRDIEVNFDRPKPLEVAAAKKVKEWKRNVIEND